MIHVVAREVGIVWLLEHAEFPPETECVCAGDDWILGWFTVPDLHAAASAWVATVGEMPLRPCKVRFEHHEGRPPSAVAVCGEFALVMGGEEAPSIAYGGSESLVEEVTRQLGQIRWVQTLALLDWMTLGGPIPPPRPVPVTRGCRYPACGWWVTFHRFRRRVRTRA